MGKAAAAWAMTGLQRRPWVKVARSRTAPRREPYPTEFRDDVVALARRGDAPIAQIAKDSGIDGGQRGAWSTDPVRHALAVVPGEQAVDQHGLRTSADQRGRGRGALLRRWGSACPASLASLTKTS
jgi:transposase-like protein